MLERVFGALLCLVENAANVELIGALSPPLETPHRRKPLPVLEEDGLDRVVGEVVDIDLRRKPSVQ